MVYDLRHDMWENLPHRLDTLSYRIIWSRLKGDRTSLRYERDDQELEYL